MSDDSLTKLSELLKKMPGIGPRQSRRLAFWFVRQDKAFIEQFAYTVTEARATIAVCPSCKRLFPQDLIREHCGICASEARDTTMLMLVEKDVDLENIERTGSYKGLYFVLGGTTSPLDKDPEKKIRVRSFLQRLAQTQKPVKEVILALSATTEGEDTLMYLEERMHPIIKKQGITVTRLGRGLSTGTELEYVDKDTMVHALKSRN